MLLGISWILWLCVLVHITTPNTALKTTPPRFDPFAGLKKKSKDWNKPVIDALTRNPIANIVKNTYSFFYWLPRRNIPYDSPWRLFGNSTSEFIAWYQWPHNLPPYIYLSNNAPDDFFCWGLPGTTLPLGNWDPWFMQNTSPAVVKKYRESELKHGRLAMLASVGFLLQEVYHPLHVDIGGLAVTHMAQLLQLPADQGVLERILEVGQELGKTVEAVTDAAPLSMPLSLPLSLPMSLPLSLPVPLPLVDIPPVPVDYLLVVLCLAAFELKALTRNWTRWGRAEYQHQYVGNFGIGNLKDDYSSGDYGFDLLRLRPEDAGEYKDMINKELNHGRLAMIAIIGMIFQEYVTGVPATEAGLRWLDSGGVLGLILSPYTLVQAVLSLPVTLWDAVQDAVKSIDVLNAAAAGGGATAGATAGVGMGAAGVGAATAIQTLPSSSSSLTNLLL